MQNKETISVIGGDTRNIYLAAQLLSDGYDVRIHGFSLTNKAVGLPAVQSLEKAMESDIIILPLPFSKNGKTLFTSFSESEITVKKLPELLREGQKVFYGMGLPNFKREIVGKGAIPYDYYESEPLKLKNALLTAEGVIAIILEKMNITINGMRIAITGYGRIGHYLALLLNAMGANVTVFARSGTALAKASLSGSKAMDISALSGNISKFDCIVNTVPAKIFDNALLSEIRPDTLIIETASAPYGFDFDECAKLHLNIIKAFSLPGKTAPRTAGIIIAQTIEEILREAKLIDKQT